ncbi:MAG: Fumarate reductase flavoprotein subunit precursor [Syntrophorhabdus sp. PtaB.Bin184]|nr:MAG: Fumarate reductase flavoprotein subunit precursor [Syntrophorhabdus sp. PtaB.Bin184]
MFEKQRSLGGTSNFFSGMFAVETARQRENYITYSRDEAFRNIMEYSHWRANARLVRAVVDESAETIAWLLALGVEFRPETINMPEAPKTYHPVKGQGTAIIKALAESGKEKGVEFELGASVKRIIKEGGQIRGIIAERDGEEMEVGARAVVIASGGYANNKEWIKKYSGFDLGVNLMPIGNVDKMGDGIRMAFEVGAAEEGLGVLETYAAGPFGEGFAMKGPLEMAAAQPDLWVDPGGERFCDESIAFYGTSMGNANGRSKEGYTYRLFDDSILQILMEKGIEKQLGMDNPPGTRPVDFEKELRAAEERGSKEVFAADSVEQLAEKMGVEGRVLEATVVEYNGFCAKGHDALFVKNPKYLRPLIGPRYYAVKARTLFLGTLGGIKINYRAEVLDKKGDAIPGLYAGGFDAGGMWGDSYCIRVSSGLSAGFSANSGRIAGKNALIYLK